MSELKEIEVTETSAIGKLHAPTDEGTSGVQAAVKKAWRSNAKVRFVEESLDTLLRGLGPEQAELHALIRKGLHLVYDQGFLDGMSNTLDRLDAVTDRRPQRPAL